MAYKIEKGIPLVPIKKSDGRPPTYPYRVMEVGDSFFVPGSSTDKFYSNTCRWRHETGFDYKAREVEGGVRVWRVK